MSIYASAAAFDYARDRVADAGGKELLERLEHLDKKRAEPRLTQRFPNAPDRGAKPDYDLAMIGGGLSLLYAPILAKKGAKVAVFERSRAGQVHREWNASVAELQRLVDVGLLEPEELERLIIKVYDRGFCRWHRGGEYPVYGVLDAPVDAHALLELTRKKSLEAGVEFFDQHTLVGQREGSEAIAMRFETGGNDRDVTARFMVDGRGASSPYATGDLLCPTVGGVMRNLDEGDDPRKINPMVGEILATTEHVEDGRQHIWEGFPVRPKETTVYLFYYSPTSKTPPGALISLYDRFFETLPRYKTGNAELVRPTFGYITGWSRLTKPPTPPSPRIALVGDAASRHSPLTFCGFGSMLRSLGPASYLLTEALNAPKGRVVDLECIVDDAPIHRGTGLLSWMMANPDPKPSRAHELNDLLDVAFSSLYDLGNDVYASMLKDEISMKNFARFLHRTSLKRPRVYRDVFGRLGPRFVGRWGVQIAREIARA